MWKSKTPEEIREYNRKYRQRNLARVVAKQKEWTKNNPDKVKALEARKRAKGTNARAVLKYKDSYKGLVSRAKNNLSEKMGVKRSDISQDILEVEVVRLDIIRILRQEANNAGR